MTPGTPDHLSHGGRIHDDPDPASVLDFSSNVNPYGPPRAALAAARRALKRVGLYPDPEVRGFGRPSGGT
jgi:histidinol-phosphate/aromatic aminotransferase/cobyric acid decarboxylase-like protein